MTVKNRSSFATVVLWGLLLTFSGSLSLSAQHTVRDLSGSVQDGNHEPLRGAVVYLENESTRGVLTYITDRSGHFSFKRLQGDVDYDVWAIYRGQSSKKKTLSQFETKADPVIELVIKSE